MSFRRLLLDVQGSIATVTLNRPEQLNAIDDDMRHDFAELVGQLAGDAAIRVVIFAGAGRAFCAGGSVEHFEREWNGVEFRARSGRLSAFFDELEMLEKPVIAAIHGACTGAGLALALALSTPLMAQLSLPRPSPNASVQQLVGVTEIKVDYSRPGVMERKIWGELVPYDKVWRTGANEPTIITISKDVKVNGSELKAGSYSIHSIPTTGDWTVIFNSAADPKAGYSYDETKKIYTSRFHAGASRAEHAGRPRVGRIAGAVHLVASRRPRPRDGARDP